MLFVTERCAILGAKAGAIGQRFPVLGNWLLHSEAGRNAASEKGAASVGARDRPQNLLLGWVGYAHRRVL